MIERLRALEKAVELVAKATKGPWAFMNEKFDDCLLAFGTDSLEYDAPPPWYSCWTSINPDDGRALIAAVNFIREHGSALIAELGQEVGAVPNGKLVGWWNGITPGFDGMGVPSVRWGADAENSRHDIPLYDGYNPIHYVTPPSSPAHTSEARDAARSEAYDKVDRFLRNTLMDAAYAEYSDALEIACGYQDAAMRQEGGE